MALAFIMMTTTQLTGKEVAEVLGITAETVSMHVGKFRKCDEGSQFMAYEAERKFLDDYQAAHKTN
jgi:predicted transcriptional regulator